MSTLNVFHIVFKCFYCWLWTDKCLLGTNIVSFLCNHNELLWCSTCSFFLNVGIERAINMHYLMLLKPSHYFARRGFMWVYREGVSSKNTSPANSVFYWIKIFQTLLPVLSKPNLYLGAVFKLKKTYCPFSWVGFSCLKDAEPLRGDRLLLPQNACLIRLKSVFLETAPQRCS